MIKEKQMQGQNIHKKFLYNFFVQTLRIEQKELMTYQMDITTDNVVVVHYETTIIPMKTPQRPDIVLHHETEVIMTKVLLLKFIHVLDMITINEILDPIVFLIDYTDQLTDPILVLDTNHVLIPEPTIFTKYTSSFRPPSRPRDSRYSRSRSHSNTRNIVITVQPINK